jgi:energy-coupling factor transporter ATP-binding protein EcfA2
MFGMTHEECDQRTMASLQMAGLIEARNRPVAAYSKGMRQRAKLAQATAHDPKVVVLDEPLNGLDPLARAEAIALFQQWGKAGRHVLVSSHILHEVDRISDQVILLSQGYVVAEGQIHSVRSEVKEQPMQILVRCDRPSMLAARLFQQDHVVEAKVNPDGKGLLLEQARGSQTEVFDRAVDEAFELIGCGLDYIRTRRHSCFTAEVHVRYLRELKAGDPVRATLQLLEFDSKRLHYFEQLFHAADGWVSATSENMSLHVDMDARKTAAFPPEVATCLARMKAAHEQLPPPEAAGRRISMPDGR